MKKGFTMIELIFVIVILGILASVAIPKLYGTKTEAEIAKVMANIKAIQTDLTSYYLIHGNFADNISDMTNVSLTDTGSTFKHPLKGGLKVGGVNCIAVTAMPAGKASGGNPRSSGPLNDWYGTPGGVKDNYAAFNGGVDSFLATTVKESETNPLCKKVQDDPQVQSILGARYQHNGKWYGGIPIASSIY